MNDKITKHIQETLSTLHLGKTQTEYLESCLNIAYMFGTKDGLQEGMDIMTRSFNTRIDKELQK